jgi:adenylosuccinate synthase
MRPVLAARVERANRLLELMGSTERVSLESEMALLERWAPRLLPLTVDSGLMVYRAIKDGKRVLLEGAQGSLLDVDHGTYPFVTSSNTTAGGAAVGAGIGPTAIHGVLGVVKAYTTRVGNGPLPTEAVDDSGTKLRELGGEFGAVTGRPRRCGWFDATVVRYAVRVNGLTGLAVTKLDVLDGFTEIPVGIAYRLDGSSCAEMPSEVDLLGRVQPVYETLPGWNRPTGEARKLSDLPLEARRYLDRLEQLSGTPIRYVSVGTRRDQIIEV